MARFYSCLHPKTGTSAIVLLLLTSALIPGGVSSLHAQQSASPADHGPIFSLGRHIQPRGCPQIAWLWATSTATASSIGWSPTSAKTLTVLTVRR